APNATSGCGPVAGSDGRSAVACVCPGSGGAGVTGSVFTTAGASGTDRFVVGRFGVFGTVGECVTGAGGLVCAAGGTICIGACAATGAAATQTARPASAIVRSRVIAPAPRPRDVAPLRSARPQRRAYRSRQDRRLRRNRRRPARAPRP